MTAGIAVVEVKAADSWNALVDSALPGSHDSTSLSWTPVSFPARVDPPKRMTNQSARTIHLLRRPVTALMIEVGISSAPVRQVGQGGCQRYDLAAIGNSSPDGGGSSTAAGHLSRSTCSCSPGGPQQWEPSVVPHRWSPVCGGGGCAISSSFRCCSTRSRTPRSCSSQPAQSLDCSPPHLWWTPRARLGVRAVPARQRVSHPYEVGAQLGQARKLHVQLADALTEEVLCGFAGALTCVTNSKEVADVAETQPKALRALDEAKPVDCLLAIASVRAARPCCRRKKASTFVVANRVWTHTNHACDLCDAHAGDRHAHADHGSSRSALQVQAFRQLFCLNASSRPFGAMTGTVRSSRTGAIEGKESTPAARTSYTRRGCSETL